ncbi:MAG: hypothetical protein EA417_22890 [Gammaproteobacteria bacterium]|nr:MAG: hypothetical protein EA417_22890 [Gammaproteobacteria bacterium]
MQRCVYSTIAAVLGLLMLAHLGDPQRWLWMGMYGAGAGLALTICKRDLHLWTLRILAIAATATLFIFAFGFFSRAPYLGPEWYQADGNARPLALLAATFCMLAVVSGYTCRMKGSQDDDHFGEAESRPSH